jgi:hypothetical protein
MIRYELDISLDIDNSLYKVRRKIFGEMAKMIEKQFKKQLKQYNSLIIK